MVKRSHTIHQISIHAPTRGATIDELEIVDKEIFQSTLLQEERLIRSPPYKFQASNFNPRSYKRSDTSTWRRTLAHYNFNPRSYKRSDFYDQSALDNRSLFQSTLLQEERQQKCTIFLMHLCNNYCIVSI